jgi:hypothetical protein
VDGLPAVTVVGFALKVAVGGSLTMTVTVAGLLVPPAPVHVRTNVASSPSAPVLRLPLAAKAPLQLPEAVHDVALVEDHFSVVEPPASIVVLDASSDAVGSAGGGAGGDGGGSEGEDPPPQPVRPDTPSMIKTMKRMEFRREVRSRAS